MVENVSAGPRDAGGGDCIAAGSAPPVDVDGDGDVDLFASDFTGLYLQRNDGAGNFTAEPIALPPGFTINGFYVGDFDGNGDPDVLLITYGNSRLLDNDGTGHFTDVSARLGGLEYGGGLSVAVADLDGDGDLDVIPGAIACNNLRALVSTALPRLGGSLSLRVAAGPGIAPPGTVAIVALATAVSGQRRLPGIQGLLWLDLLQTTTVGVLVLPTPAGVAALGVPLPPLPALAGMRLFGQALIASPTSGFGFTPLLVENIVP